MSLDAGLELFGSSALLYFFTGQRAASIPLRAIYIMLSILSVVFGLLSLAKLEQTAIAKLARRFVPSLVPPAEGRESGGRAAALTVLGLAVGDTALKAVLHLVEASVYHAAACPTGRCVQRPRGHGWGGGRCVGERKERGEEIGEKEEASCRPAATALAGAFVHKSARVADTHPPIRAAPDQAQLGCALADTPTQSPLCMSSHLRCSSCQQTSCLLPRALGALGTASLGLPCAFWIRMSAIDSFSVQSHFSSPRRPTHAFRSRVPAAGKLWRSVSAWPCACAPRQRAASPPSPRCSAAFGSWLNTLPSPSASSSSPQSTKTQAREVL